MFYNFNAINIFSVKDENGNEIPAGDLGGYEMEVNVCSL